MDAGVFRVPDRPITDNKIGIVMLILKIIQTILEKTILFFKIYEIK